ncbi:MAG: hypothetical protein ABSE73_29670, partial [Planctomycetota bacterium]
MLLIGIDEAGYGPTLGPLCHGYAAFHCPPPTPSRKGRGNTEVPDLWALLHPAVSRHPATGNSITVDDSKKVYSPGLGLGLLTRGVAAFLGCAAARLDAEDALYQRLLPEADRRRLEEDPWGQQLDGLANRAATVRERTLPLAYARGSETDSLRHTLKTRNIAVLALGARALSAKHFNASLGGRENKADASWRVIAAELQRLLALCADGEDVHVTIDRQGGRKFYAAQL